MPTDAGADLSSWKVALVALSRFMPTPSSGFNVSFYGLIQRRLPAYGMAEATLLISGGSRGAGHITRTVSRSGLQALAAGAPADQDDVQILVGCGRALVNERIAIVDPDHRTRLPPDRVGEVWVNGPNVARAYWRNADTTAAGLHARIDGEDDGANWLRTGDLGFLDASGELFITGRSKDLLIIRGINQYPQDIRAHRAGPASGVPPELRRGVLGARRTRR